MMCGGGAGPAPPPPAPGGSPRHRPASGCARVGTGTGTRVRCVRAAQRPPPPPWGLVPAPVKEPSSERGVPPLARAAARRARDPPDPGPPPRRPPPARAAIETSMNRSISRSKDPGGWAVAGSARPPPMATAAAAAAASEEPPPPPPGVPGPGLAPSLAPRPRRPPPSRWRSTHRAASTMSGVTLTGPPAPLSSPCSLPGRTWASGVRVGGPPPPARGRGSNASRSPATRSARQEKDTRPPPGGGGRPGAPSSRHRPTSRPARARRRYVALKSRGREEDEEGQAVGWWPLPRPLLLPQPRPSSSPSESEEGEADPRESALEVDAPVDDRCRLAASRAAAAAATDPARQAAGSACGKSAAAFARHRPSARAATARALQVEDTDAMSPRDSAARMRVSTSSGRVESVDGAQASGRGSVDGAQASGRGSAILLPSRGSGGGRADSMGGPPLYSPRRTGPAPPHTCRPRVCVSAHACEKACAGPQAWRGSVGHRGARAF